MKFRIVEGDGRKGSKIMFTGLHNECLDPAQALLESFAHVRGWERYQIARFKWDEERGDILPDAAIVLAQKIDG